ncbi:methyl-accepting chemotaxis protein, partial [bacterium]|nr:methyl-accepting chemotaxis protein [bacterium]
GNSQEVKDDSYKKLQELRDTFLLYINGTSALIKESLQSDLDLNQGGVHLKAILNQSRAFSARAEQERDFEQKEAFASAALLLIVALIGGFLCSRSITKSLKDPIHLALKFFESVLQGDITNRVEVKSKDEIGKMIESLNLMADSMQDHANTAQSISEGNLNNEVTILSEEDVFGKSLTNMQERLSYMVHNITNSSLVVESGSVQISQACRSLSDGINSSSVSLRQISVAMTEVGDQPEINANNAI